jgi:acyl carrier protein
MGAPSIRERLCAYLFGSLMPTPPESRPGDDADLFESGLDSVRIMRLLVFLEEEFRVRLPDEEITPERIGTVNALVALVEQARRR